MKLHSSPIAKKGFEQLQIDFTRLQNFVRSPSGLLHGIAIVLALLTLWFMNCLLEYRPSKVDAIHQ
jgi:hypothetical protein